MSNRVIPDTYEKFLELCRQGTVVPVFKRVLADMMTPVSAFLRIVADHHYAFLLESVEGGEKVARYSFIGVDPHLILRCRDGEVWVEENGESRREDLPPIPAIRRYAGRF